MAKVTFGNILGGVNYTVPPNELPQYSLADAQNIVPILTGYGAPRGGSSRLAQYGSTIITSLHEFVSGGTSYVFAASGTKVGVYTTATGAFADHITGLTSGAYGQWWNYGDYAIYANGANNVQKSTGAAGNDLTADLAGIPGGRCVAEWGERIWIGGYDSNIARLTGSALREPTNFSTAGDAGFWQGYVGNKKQGITALFPFFDILMIGKLNQIYQLTGAPETDSSTFRLLPLQTKDKDSFGFTAKNAITQVGNDCIFLDGFNIKALSGIQSYGDVESISIIGNIKDFFRDPAGAGLDTDYLQYARFFHYKHKEQIYCSIPTGASTRYWFVIDYSNQEMRQKAELPKYSFFPMTGLIPISITGVENGSMVDPYAGLEDGWVVQLDTGTNDHTTAVDSHMTWCFGLPGVMIQPGYIDLFVRGSGVTLASYYVMGLQEWQEIIDSTNYTALASEDTSGSSWRTGGTVAHKRIASFLYNTGESFAFKLRHNTAGETYEMRKSTFAYTPKYGYA
ncbi:MAG: hypothetical protein ABIE47_08090 [Pseudomonadota bacterium]